MQYLDIIILAGIFIFIALKLWSTLGTTPEQGSENPGPSKWSKPKVLNNVVTLPGVRDVPQPAENMIKPFSSEEFLKGAQIFCKGVINSKTEAELRSFKRYMSSGPYSTLKKLMEPLFDRGEALIFKDCKVLKDELEDFIMDVTVQVEFTGLEKPSTQKWIFRRDVRSEDPNWLLQNILKD